MTPKKKPGPKGSGPKPYKPAAKVGDAADDGTRPARRSLDLEPEVEEAELRELYRRHLDGDRTAVLRAIAFCGNQARVMPDWLVAGYFKAMNEWWSYRAKSIDEAFGVVLAKGVHLEALKKRRRFAGAVYMDVVRLKNEGRAINAALFAEVGAKHGLGKTLAEDYYRHAARELASAASAGVKLLLEPFSTPEAKRRRATRNINKLSGSRSKNG